MARRVLLFVVAVLTFVVPAFARTESSGAARIGFDVPDAWTTSSRNSQVLVQSADRALAVEVDYVTSADQMRQGLAQLHNVMTTRFQSVSYEGQPNRVSQAGLVGAGRHGTATRNGQTVRFFALALGHQAGGVIVVGFVAATATQADINTMLAVIRSFRRLG